MHLNTIGTLVVATWFAFPRHYHHIILDAFVVMPNHIHGIIVLTDPEGIDPVGAGLGPAPTNIPLRIPKRHGLPEIVRAFKSFSSREINRILAHPGTPQ